MVLKYQLSPYPTLLEDMVVKIWESDNDSPGQEVYTQVLPQDIGGGHPNIQTIIASGLDLQPHRVRLYGVTSNNLLHYYEAEPRIDVVTVFDPIRFKIGDGGTLTPAANSNEYIDPLFAGLTDKDFVVIRNGKGAMHPVHHYNFDEPNTKIQLVNADTFNLDEEITILMSPKSISTLVNDSVTGKFFRGFVDISSPISYSATHLRKLLRFTATTTFSFDSAPPTSYGHMFTNIGAGTGTIAFNNAPLKWGATTKATLELPPYSECCITWDGTNYNVVYLTDSTIFNAGSVVPPGTILGVGTVFIGSVPNGGDLTTTINHNKNISGDYLVFLSRKSGGPASASRDNDIQLAWYHADGASKPNAFILAYGDPFNVGSAESLTVCYQLIKI